MQRVSNRKNGEEKESGKEYIPMVLGVFSILKEDTLLSHLGREKEEKGLNGADNYRIVKNIFGLSQPTAEGIKGILNTTENNIIWMNLREEPIIYLNGRPYVLRDKDRPFTNIRSFIGISYERLESMEERLKKDIEEIAKENRGFIDVYIERKNQILQCNRLFVSTVQTARELFEMIGRERLKYFRTPVSRKLYNRENFLSVLDRILTRIEDKENYLFGFNCGSGLSKTSYAMAACLLNSKISALIANKHILLDESFNSPTINLSALGDAAISIAGTHSPVTVEKYHNTNSISEINSPKDSLNIELRIIRILEQVLDTPISKWLESTGNVMPILEKALKGEYILVERLVAAFNGGLAKKITDQALIELGKVSILESLLKGVIRAHLNKNASQNIARSTVLLERYISLIIYGIYKIEEIDSSFIEWVENTPAVKGYAKPISNGTYSQSIFSPMDLLRAPNDLTKDTKHWNTLIGARTILRADSSTREYPKESFNDIYIVHQPGLECDLSYLPKGVIWVSLRSEPVIYIEGVPHSERDRLSPNKNMKSVPGITRELIENQENILCKRIEAEEAQVTGKVVLFDTLPTGELVARKVKVKEHQLKTSSEYINILPLVQRYEKIPMISKSPLTPTQIHSVLQLILKRNSTPIVFQASGYMGRSKITRILAVLIEETYKYNQQRNNTIEDRSKERDITSKEIQNSISSANYIARPVPISSIETLIRILSNGVVSDTYVRQVYERCTGKDIYDDLESTAYEYRSILLANYFLLICTASFILSSSGSIEQFRQWLNSRPDIINIYNRLSEISITTQRQVPVPKRPWGTVLTPHTLLKNDFFPALKILNNNELDIKGCTNLRIVQFRTNRTVGLAQPAEWGVGELIKYLGEVPNKIHWFCLRQEPVVYLDGLPFVLRTSDQIYENVITEGISKEWVENIEERMKNDCIEESKQNGIIVHDEVIEAREARITENIQHTLPEHIKTPREIFSVPQMVYYRMPISDEQTPIPEIFDEMHKSILSIPIPRTVIFSCQMGRGRTTTGMVISGLISFAEYFKSLSPTEREHTLKVQRDAVVYEDKYPIISKLLQVLKRGKESKNLIDSLINQCNHIQNIYHAIAKQTGTGYLMRYFYLISFGSFLIENIDTNKTFKEYLSECQEIDGIANEK
ncbi:hypothetical protein NEOKW01_0943 [Nematocida sp. AWRm80]|nr:hypothetical protein NEOKW01_0943 [Nematocida sp. AWRm80]